MKLLLAGLAAREQAALELFLRREKPDWSFQSVAAEPAGSPGELTPWPAADLIILDLAAFGWAQASAVNAAQLARRCAHTPALLLVAAHDTAWAALRQQIDRPDWVWLAKPYNAQAMLDALAEASQRQAQAAAQQLRAQRLALARAERAALAPNQPESPVRRAQAAPDLIANQPPAQPPQAALARATAAAAPPASPRAMPSLDSSTAPSGLAPAQRQADSPAAPTEAQRPAQAQSACAALARALAGQAAGTQKLARLVLEGCALGTPFELRFTLNHSVLIDPAAGWVAGNTPEVVVRQVARSDTLAHALSLRPWPDAAQARARLTQMGWAQSDLTAWLGLLGVAQPA